MTSPDCTQARRYHPGSLYRTIPAPASFRKSDPKFHPGRDKSLTAKVFLNKCHIYRTKLHDKYILIATLSPPLNRPSIAPTLCLDRSLKGETKPKPQIQPETSPHYAPFISTAVTHSHTGPVAGRPDQPGTIGQPNVKQRGSASHAKRDP